MSGQPERTQTSAFPWSFILAIVAVALVMRGPIIAVAPIVDQIRSSLGLTAAQAGLLTSLPVLCFAVITPAASFLIARVGSDLATTIAVAAIVVGAVVRSLGGTPALFAGTVVIGAGITIANVVVPVLIRRDVQPARVGLATGVYTSFLNVGAMIASLVSAPLADAAGWGIALLVWAAVAVLALASWLIVARRPALHVLPVRPSAETEALRLAGDDGEDGRHGGSGRRAGGLGVLTPVLLCLAFAGQAFSYYGLAAWLPSLLVDELGFTESQAGASSSVFQIAAVIGAIGVPLIARRAGLVTAAVIVAVLWLTVPIGLLVAPAGWLVVSILGGSAQGGGITLVFIAIVGLARTGTQARRLSALTQGVGYAVAATAPTLIGAVHDATRAWSAPLTVVLVSVLVFGVAAVWSAVRATEVGRRRVLT